jgi:ammonium transporter
LVIRTHNLPWLALSLISLVGFCAPGSAQKPELLPIPKEQVAEPPKKAEPPKMGEAKAPDEKSDASKAEEAKKGEPETKKNPLEEAVAKAQTTAEKAQASADQKGDTAWMLVASALVMLMVPGLALFYGGMVRKKNVLATMMQSYAALAVVGLWWIAVGYSLAFGPSILKIGDGGIVGWSSDLLFLKGIESTTLLPGYNIPVYVHVMFQGMFAIVTPALISGALAERIRFWPFCIFMVAWVTFVYCPLAHMVWAFDWFYTAAVDGKTIGASAIGLLGKMGALDFAGGTVVHIAAGCAGLAAALVLRKRTGYPEHAMHPNSMVLTLVGAGLLWFGWFGFNGGSSGYANPLAGSAFAATQAAAAAAGLSWILVEWLVKGKPTALGLASGIVAGLVAVTPASGFVYMWGGAVIGAIAGVVCYFAVSLKSMCGYDDSLDAFGVHAIGGFLGAILTGIFCYTAINSAGADGYFAVKGQQAKIADLRAQYPDAETMDAIADLEKKVKDLEAAIEQAKTDKKPEDEKSATSDLNAAKAELAAAVAGWKKGPANQRLEKLAEILTEKEPALKKATAEKEAADTAYESAAMDGFKANEKAKADEMEKARTAFEKAKDEQEKKTDAFLKIATEVNELKAEQTKLTAAKAELASFEKLASLRWGKEKGPFSQFGIQVKAALIATIFAFFGSMVLALIVHIGTGGNFTTSVKEESEGLDQTEHGEVGFDYGAYDAIPTGSTTEPKAAKVPPGGKRFVVVVEGVDNGELMKSWSELCVPSDQPIDPDFLAVYPYVTTIQGNRFRLRGGDPATLSAHIQKLFQKKLGKQLKVRVEV